MVRGSEGAHAYGGWCFMCEEQLHPDIRRQDTCRKWTEAAVSGIISKDCKGVHECEADILCQMHSHSVVNQPSSFKVQTATTKFKVYDIHACCNFCTVL